MTEKNLFSDEKFQKHVANVANVAGLNFDEATEPKNEEMENALEIINNALSICKDEHHALLADDFLKAYEFIKKADRRKFAEIRVRIKQEKPGSVKISDIDRLSNSKESGSGDNVAEELIGIVTKQGKLFYDGRTERSYVTADIGDIQQTMAINGKQFMDWVSHQYYAATGKSASEAAIKQAKFTLSGVAKHDGERQRIYLRAADYNNGHYIFLADEQLRAVEVTAAGWRITDNPHVKFWKPAAMQSLPIPKKGGSLNLLWKFVNVNANDRPLLLAWLIESFRSETPKPVLSLSGTQGSAKSSTQDKIRQLVDNNTANLRSAPKSTQDIFVSAGRNWVISYENLSYLSAQIQDAFCTLATGGGFATRTLYSDDDETIIEAKRPVIINSIPNVITAQDLTDRAICLELPQIEYREEIEIQKEWQAAMPEIFGGILDLFVKTLQKLPHIKLTKPPRMADFARLGEAMMQAQGKSAGEFTKLYREKLNEGVNRAMESSPAAVALRELAQKFKDGETVFYGTVQGLLNKLVNYRHDSENWPRSARGLADVLRRQTPALFLLGISIEIGSSVQRIDGERGVPVTIKNQGGNIGNVGNVFSKVFAEKKNISDSSVRM